ncbi:MAG: poly-A polymerase [Parachlamydia sp.]|nr:MAG: poly-A polymerase [Parachlamydia sp.]
MDDSYKHALGIVKKLVKAGYVAYFAGGWVRDYLMKHPSSDIDIATNASPEEILDLFPHTLLVGLAFGVVIVLIEGHQFEVSTFRQDFDYTGRKPAKIELSTPYEDAQRRDFTINGMFYDPLEDTIYDYVHGIEDIKKGVIRTIGNPQERFLEDRLRMVRAIRFASRFGFLIDPETQEAICENADTLFPSVAKERIWQEFNKMRDYPRFDHALIELHRSRLLPEIFPSLAMTHLNEIKKRVQPFALYPATTPTILFLIQLFPDESIDFLLEICKELKTGKNEWRYVEVYCLAKRLIEEASHPKKKVEWTRFYALPESSLCLEVLAANHLIFEEQEKFKASHLTQQEHLSPHIARIQNKTPLITAHFLMNQGILPGKQMGMLLKEAEELVILLHLDDPNEVLALLKRTTLWPKQEEKHDKHTNDSKSAESTH